MKINKYFAIEILTISTVFNKNKKQENKDFRNHFIIIDQIWRMNSLLKKHNKYGILEQTHNNSQYKSL